MSAAEPVGSRAVALRPATRGVWNAGSRTSSDVVYVLGWAFVASVPLLNAVMVPGVGSLARLAGIPFGALGFLSLVSMRRRRALTDAHVLAFVFAGWAACSYFWSADPVAARAGIATVGQLLLMLLLLWEFGQGADRLRGLLGAFVVGAAGGLAALLWSAAASSADAARYTLSAAHPNSIAFVLALAIPMACYLAGTGASPWRRAACWFFVPSAVTGILLTGSRSALATLGAAMLMAPTALRGVSRLGRLAVIVALVLAILVPASLLPDRPLERLTSFGEELTADGLNGRTTIWAQSMDALAARPLTGLGIRSSPLALEQARGAPAGAHNTWLSVLLELGVIGLALFAAMLLAAAVHALRSQATERRLAAVLLFTLAIGLVPRHWEYERPTWLVIALLLALGSELRDDPTPTSHPLEHR